MSDMDIVEIDDENQFHGNKNENFKLTSQSGKIVFDLLKVTS